MSKQRCAAPNSNPKFKPSLTMLHQDLAWDEPTLPGDFIFIFIQAFTITVTLKVILTFALTPICYAVAATPDRSQGAG